KPAASPAGPVATAPSDAKMPRMALLISMRSTRRRVRVVGRMYAAAGSTNKQRLGTSTRRLHHPARAALARGARNWRRGGDLHGPLFKLELSPVSAGHYFFGQKERLAPCCHGSLGATFIRVPLAPDVVAYGPGVPPRLPWGRHLSPADGCKNVDVNRV